MADARILFLTLCKEKNFHKAAAECYVTQQCLSSCIRRLEQQYGASLFFRKPAVMLTPAGEALRRTMEQELILEQNLLRELSELSSGARGIVRVGINASRAQLLIPPILQRFHQVCPYAQLHIRTEDTKVMGKMLSAGELDCFIGIDTPYLPEWVCERLLWEDVFLIIPADFCMQMKSDDPDILRMASKFPFVRNSAGSTLNEKINALLGERKLTLRQIASISDYGVQLELCRRGIAAAFCPQMVARTVVEGPVRMFRVPGLEHALRVDLVYTQESVYSASVQAALMCIRQCVAEMNNKKQNVTAHNGFAET